MEDRMTFLTNTPTMGYRCDFTDHNFLFIPYAQHQMPTAVLHVRIYDTHGHEIVDSIVRVHRRTYAVAIMFATATWHDPYDPLRCTLTLLPPQSGTVVISTTFSPRPPRSY